MCESRERACVLRRQGRSPPGPLCSTPQRCGPSAARPLPSARIAGPDTAKGLSRRAPIRKRPARSGAHRHPGPGRPRAGSPVTLANRRRVHTCPSAQPAREVSARARPGHRQHAAIANVPPPPAVCVNTYSSQPADVRVDGVKAWLTSPRRPNSPSRVLMWSSSDPWGRSHCTTKLVCAHAPQRPTARPPPRRRSARHKQSAPAPALMTDPRGGRRRVRVRHGRQD